jgi:hypothetical protein
MEAPVNEPWEERVFAIFMDGGRLKQVPARRKKRLVILKWLADHFRPAERYTEAQVNEILLRYHDDPAYLRRLLVDEELMHRHGGVYWRAGTLPHPRWSGAG